MSKRNREKHLRDQAAGDAPKDSTNKGRIIGVSIVVLIAMLIIGGAVAVKMSSENNTQTNPNVIAAPTPEPTHALPVGVLPAGDPQEYGFVEDKSNGAKVPLLEVWEDFQCPACGRFEQAFGPSVKKLVDAGKVKAVIRPAIFIDQNVNNDASLRAVNVWGCAIDAGKGREYHDVIYANQPVKEGDGWTNEQLLAFGVQTGMDATTLQTFTDCAKKMTYSGWASNSNDAFVKSGAGGTPYILLNGVVMDLSKLSTVEQFEQALTSGVVPTDVAGSPAPATGSVAPSSSTVPSALPS